MRQSVINVEVHSGSANQNSQNEPDEFRLHSSHPFTSGFETSLHILRYSTSSAGVVFQVRPLYRHRHPGDSAHTVPFFSCLIQAIGVARQV
jgi:hypothetical protein